jgi:cytochrome c-type biogenesis protein CcmF
MLFAHLGVAVFILGVTLSRGYETETAVKMGVGDTAHLSGYTFQLAALDSIRGPNYESVRASVEVTKGGERVATLRPEKRFYTVQKMPMTETALDLGPWRHLYLSMGEAIGEGTWTLRIYVKPFVGWIWGGCLLMGLGGALAALDRRYRVAKDRGADPAMAAHAPAG